MSSKWIIWAKYKYIKRNKWNSEGTETCSCCFPWCRGYEALRNHSFTSDNAPQYAPKSSYLEKCMFLISRIHALGTCLQYIRTSYFTPFYMLYNCYYDHYNYHPATLSYQSIKKRAPCNIVALSVSPYSKRAVTAKRRQRSAINSERSVPPVARRFTAHRWASCLRLSHLAPCRWRWRSRLGRRTWRRWKWAPSLLLQCREPSLLNTDPVYTGKLQNRSSWPPYHSQSLLGRASVRASGRDLGRKTQTNYRERSHRFSRVGFGEPQVSVKNSQWGHDYFKNFVTWNFFYN